MNKLNTLIILLFVAFVSGCDQAKEPASDKAPAKVEAVKGDSSQSENTASAKAPEVAQKVAEEAKEKEEKPKKPLNLAIPDTDVSAAAANDQGEAGEKRVLPNMFGKSEQGTKVGGGIIRDAENQDYVDSIEGAEVSVEFTTD
ncbi:MAG: hypothetical protein MI867_25885 [Pseudomonadales bacterium]|nr:hypothetical protein [Pseudomonadales bacterium]